MKLSVVIPCYNEKDIKSVKHQSNTILAHTKKAKKSRKKME